MVRYSIHKNPPLVLILSQINILYYLPIDPQTFQVASFTQVSPPIFCMGLSPPTPIRASCHPTLKFLNLISQFWLGEEYKVTTLRTVQISQAFNYCLCLRLKCLPQRCVLEHCEHHFLS